METELQLMAALLGSLGFAANFNIHGKKMIFAGVGGLFAWGIYLITELFNSDPYICAFSSAVALTIYSEIMARVHKTPVTVFIVICVIPLVPGAALYRTFNHLLQHNMEMAYAQGLYTLLFAASMSLGITLTTLIFRVTLKLLKKRIRKS